ncbi:unnamed protein product [Trichogramma brassicae]|uniref:Uncharacterized protein n=1 Tax=Trichogramma brassicae TaxID=86971 RepID=A0A6H5IMW2_9HYME|nr:unnamed protein product [Trichogramma brassicae]
MRRMGDVWKTTTNRSSRNAQPTPASPKQCLTADTEQHHNINYRSGSPRRGLTRLAIDGAQHSHDEVRSENHTHKRAPDAGAKAQLERMMAPEARTTLTR